MSRTPSSTMSRYLLLLGLPSLAAAYSFNIDNTPRQCEDLTVSITGSGQPPYTLLVIPFGPTPLNTSKEVRRIIQKNFTDNSITFPLNYPVSSQFIVQLSDQSGFGSGGATAAVTVLDSSNSSCYDPNVSVQPGFYYSLVPNSLQQCSPTRFWWDPSPTAGVQGTPFFAGVIPGGQSLQVPQGTLTNVSEQGLGYNWSPSVRAGTTVVIIAGDDRGLGSGGSSTYFINNGDNSSCLDATSPSSTAGSPAGGSYPTSTSGAGTGGSSGGGHHTDTGAIVGGVVGGVVGAAALVLLALFFWRRRRYHKLEKRPVDLLNEDDAPDGNPPQYYEPEPFVVPEPTAASSAGETSTVAGAPRPSMDHRQSHYSNLTGERSATPDQSAVSGSTYMRKSPAPPSFRPVNIIQHDDAGPSELPPETIELPPAYTNIHTSRPKAADEEGESSTTTPSEPAASTQVEQAAS